MNLLRRSYIILALSLFIAGPSYAHGPVHKQIDDLTRRIAQRPADADLYWRRADLYREHRDFESALIDYERVIELDPGARNVFLGVAGTLVDASRYDEALVAIDRLLTTDPDNAEGRLIRAYALAGLGRFADAAQDAERAFPDIVRLTPAMILNRVRWLAAAGGDDAIENALEAIDDGISRFGRLVTLQTIAIDLECQRGTFDAALERLATIEDTIGSEYAIAYRRGDILTEAHRTMEAQAAYTEALESIECLPDAKRHAPHLQQLERTIRLKLSSHAGGDP